MYDRHVALERDEAETGDGRVQSDPDKLFVRDELTQEVAPPTDVVDVPQFDGENDQ